MGSQAHHFANALAAVAPAPTTADSIVRVVERMPVVETLKLVARLLNDPKFADLTNVYFARIEDAIADLLEEADAEPQPNHREDAADQRYYRSVAA